MTVGTSVASVGAAPALFTHVVVGHVIVYAVPSSMMSVIASPAAMLSVSDVIEPVRVTVWIEPLAGSNSVAVSYTHLTLPTKRIV